MHISVDRRLDIFRRVTPHLDVSGIDVEAASAYLADHGHHLEPTPPGGYQPDAWRFDLPSEAVRVGVALRLCALGGNGTITALRSAGVRLDDVRVCMAQDALGGTITTTVLVNDQPFTAHAVPVEVAA